MASKRAASAAGSTRVTTPPRGSRAGRGRPPVISRERLLEVAREVFLERGVGASTAEVALRAGVSEGTVFHRFRSKARLFREAMHFDAGYMQRQIGEMVEQIEGEELDMHEALIRITHAMIEVGRLAMPLIMMSWSNPESSSDGSGFSEQEQRDGYRVMVRQLAAYFERRINEGKLRRVDSEILTRSLLSAVHHYCVTQLILLDANELCLPEGMFVRGLVDLLLTGAANPGEVPQPAGSVRRLQRT